MFLPAKKDIKSYYDSNIAVPICREIEFIKDPLAALESLKGERRFLLESSRVHPSTGRYSFFGADPFLVFQSRDRTITLTRRAKEEVFQGSPTMHLRSILNKYSSLRLEGLPSFSGGAVGYFGYDMCHHFERLPRKAENDLKLPDVSLGFYDTVGAIDHIAQRAYVISNVMPGRDLERSYNEAVGKVEKTIDELKGYRRRAFNHRPRKKDMSVHSTFTQEGFEEAVLRAKRYIRAGDIYQANISQRLSVKLSPNPYKLYRVLREINPSPFASLLDMGKTHVISSSPERLLKLEGGLVQTRPIAGTRPRGVDIKGDRRLSRNLLLSPKERAEHIMLVDLERNDLGRVCNYGSVDVDELMVLEKYSHVIHIVSNVRGRLRSDRDRLDLLRAAFPGGTITGVPKVRCMEIIDELEPVTRNIYTGSIGYLGFNGNMDLNIVIRTLLIKDGFSHVQVGSGIVADSDPTREYHETLHKAGALLKAIGVGGEFEGYR